MIKIKPLRKNHNGQYMLAATMIFCLIAVAFGLVMMFSTHINETIKAFVTDMLNGGLILGKANAAADATQSGQFHQTLFGFISIITFQDHTTFFAITPSITIISYLPIAIGGALFIWNFIVAIILNVGFKSVNKKNIKQVVNPIKWYTITIASMWFSFIVILIAMFFAYLSSSFFIFGKIIMFSSGHLIVLPTNVYTMVNNVKTPWLQAHTDLKAWWCFADWFGAKYKDARLNGSNNYLVFLLPVVPFIAGFVLQVIGIIVGAISWRWVNLYVLAAIGDAQALELVNYHLPHGKRIIYEGEGLETISAPVERGLKTEEAADAIDTIEYRDSITEEVAPQQVINNDENFIPQKRLSRKARKALKKQNAFNNDVEVTRNWDDENLTHRVDDMRFGVNATLKAQCQSFFKNCIRMMEQSDNTANSLYKKFVAAYDALVANKVDNKLSDIANGIEDYITFATDVDQKFVKLVSKVLGTNRTVFGTFSVELDDLITKYTNAIRAWNLFEAELFIEQIFTITSQNTELLAKVGYCLKYRLSNHYSFLEGKLNGIRRLNVARESKNYEGYRQTCLQIIKTMSPNKLLVSGIVNQVY